METPTTAAPEPGVGLAFSGPEPPRLLAAGILAVDASAGAATTSNRPAGATAALLR